MSTIAYLGPAGTWSEAAALLYARGEAALLPLASTPAVVSAIETGLANVGVLPVENSLEGAVGTTLDRDQGGHSVGVHGAVGMCVGGHRAGIHGDVVTGPKSRECVQHP